MKTKKFYRNWLIIIMSIIYIGLFWLAPLYDSDYWKVIIIIHLIVPGCIGIGTLIGYLIIKYEES